MCVHIVVDIAVHSFVICTGNSSVYVLVYTVVVSSVML